MKFLEGTSQTTVTISDPTLHRTQQPATENIETSTFPATDPNPPHVQQAALTTLHNVFIYREDGLSMARPEVEALQDRILLEQLASTDTAEPPTFRPEGPN